MLSIRVGQGWALPGVTCPCLGQNNMNTSSHIEAEQELFVEAKPKGRVIEYWNRDPDEIPVVTSYIDYSGHMVYTISNEPIYWSTNTIIA